MCVRVCVRAYMGVCEAVYGGVWGGGVYGCV